MSGPLVLGLGNVLLGDDGVGPAICEELSRRKLAGVRLVDGGTLGSALFPWLVEASAVVIVDALRAAGRPGEVLVYRTPAWPAGPGDGGGQLESVVAMAILGGLRREAITLVGIIPDRIEPGAILSEAVRSAVPLAASVAVREARALAGGIA